MVTLTIDIGDLDVLRTVAGLHRVVEQMPDAESELCYDLERLAERLADAALETVGDNAGVDDGCGALNDPGGVAEITGGEDR
jgi:hypothetical protein